MAGIQWPSTTRVVVWLDLVPSLGIVQWTAATSTRTGDGPVVTEEMLVGAPAPASQARLAADDILRIVRLAFSELASPFPPAPSTALAKAFAVCSQRAEYGPPVEVESAQEELF